MIRDHFDSKYVEVNGIRLNYLDWGGEGPPLVLLHGICDSPYIFADMARFLRDDFRVLAYARRGHGRSDSPEGPYDQETLTEDLLQFLDALGIERAHLLGWSMGGNEITMLAGLQPDRVAKLVYLDSAYDWSDTAFLPAFGAVLEANAPKPEDLADFDSYRAWFRSAWMGDDVPWVPNLENYLHDTVRIDADGRVQPLPIESVFTSLFASLEGPPRDYFSVQAPALALYAKPFFPPCPADPEQDRRVRDFEETVMVPFRRVSIERVRDELPSVEVLDVAHSVHMSIGVRYPESVAKTIRDFLLTPAVNADASIRLDTQSPTHHAP